MKFLKGLWEDQYSDSKDRNTFDREVEALTKMQKYKECGTRLIITKEDEGVVKDEFGQIKIIPFSKWIGLTGL